MDKNRAHNYYMVRPRRGRQRYILACLLALFVIFQTVGCSNPFGGTDSSEVENVVVKAGTVQLYHATGNSIEPDEDRYQLMQPDNLSASVEEIIEKIKINNKLVIDRYMIDENKNVTLFMIEQDPMTEEELLLNKAAIVRSIEGLGIGDVIIVIQDMNGNEIDKATYTDASFYYYDEGEED